MFASTLQTIAFKTKNVPSLTSKDTTSPYKTTIRFSPNIDLFLKSHHIVLRLKQQLKRIYQNRIQLLSRDIDQIYHKNQSFFKDVFLYNSSQQMFQDCDKDGNGKLSQQQQMYIFTTLLLKLNQKKQQLIKTQCYREFSLLLTQIKKIQTELPLLQTQIRRKILQTKKSLSKIKKQQKLQEFKKQANKTERQFFQKKQDKINQVKNKQAQQYEKLETTLYLNNNAFLYKARPSVTLRETKDLNLFQKLAPYKNQKKRQYQCQTLRKTIISNMHSQQKRINKTIEVRKNYQRNQLLKQHISEQQLLNQKQNRKYKKLLTNISHRKSQLQKIQNGKLMNLLHKDKIQMNTRIDWISKAIRVNRQKKDSNNIADIMLKHNNVAQYNNTIEQMSLLTDNYKCRNFSYFGREQIQQARLKLNKSIQSGNKQSGKKNELFFVLKPGKHEEDLIATRENEGILIRGQKSLTNLYDLQLNLIGNKK